MKETNWQDRHYREVKRGVNNHPDNTCLDRKPHFIYIIENSPYFACDTCNTAWAGRVKDAKKHGINL